MLLLLCFSGFLIILNTMSLALNNNRDCPDYGDKFIDGIQIFFNLCSFTYILKLMNENHKNDIEQFENEI